MFETILTKFVERIATVSGTRPQVVIRPLPGPVPYDGKTGVHCFVGPDEPFDTAGAGRWGYKTKRNISCLCVTESLNDPGGRSEVAAARHFAFERSVVNAGLDFHAAPVATGTAFKVRWVSGGSDMMKYVKLNPGLNGSILVFEVEYVPTLSTSLA